MSRPRPGETAAEIAARLGVILGPRADVRVIPRGVSAFDGDAAIGHWGDPTRRNHGCKIFAKQQRMRALLRREGKSNGE